MKYQIGQTVWRATWDVTPDYVVCPDCGGEGRIRVILHDETELSIGCEGCRRGYEKPDGRIKVYTRKATAVMTTIAGVTVFDGKTEWRTADSYCVQETDLFDNERDCLKRAEEVALLYDQEECDRVNKKEKDTRTWAWHVTYHRNLIKRAEKDIAYHKACLAVASVKAKEPKKEER